MSIKTKVLCVFLAGWLIVSTALFYMNVQHDRDATYRSDRIAAEFAADVIEGSLSQSMASSHKGVEVPALLDALTKGRGFRWAAVTDMSGRPAFAAGQMPPASTNQLKLLTAATATGSAFEHAADGTAAVHLVPRQVTCAACHKGSERWLGAVVTLAVLNPELRAVEADANAAMLFVSLVIGGAGLLGVWLLLNGALVRPLSGVTADVRAITPGNWMDARVNARAGGEVGQLATHINSTLDRLAAASRERDQILQTARDGFAAVDLSGRLSDVNQAFCDMHGFSRQELLGMTIGDLRAAESTDDIAHRLRAIASRGGDEFETRHRRKDGQVVILDVSASYSRHAQVFMFLRDITERRKTEERLEQAEARLQQSQKIEAVGRMAGGIAHDFNNLLTVILGFAEVALSRLTLHDPARGAIKEIQAAGRRAAELTQQMLLISAKQVADLRNEDIGLIATQLEDRLRQMIGEQISLTVVVPPTPVQAFADRQQVEQVIVSLVENARDAMPEGGQLIIDVQLVALEQPLVHQHGLVPPDAYAAVVVTDSGSGIPAHLQSRLFEPFFTTKGQGARGLGLSTARGMVTQGQGFILVTSTEGQGTSFAVYLPIALPAEAPPSGNFTTPFS